MCFKRTPPCFSQVAIEVVEFEIISSAKVLGVVIRGDLKWSAHIDSITTKAAKRRVNRVRNLEVRTYNGESQRPWYTRI